MKLLLDTHLLLLAAGHPDRLSDEAHRLIHAEDNELLFSAASLWEIATLHDLGRGDLQVDLGLLRRGLLDNEYVEMPVRSTHVVAMSTLAPLHADAFDRLLIAQAVVEGITLLTTDVQVAQYPGPVQRV